MLKSLNVQLAIKTFSVVNAPTPRRSIPICETSNPVSLFHNPWNKQSLIIVSVVLSNLTKGACGVMLLASVNEIPSILIFLGRVAF